MKKRDLSIITVNFGSSEKVINLYKSLSDHASGVNWELIVVDNPTKKGGDGEILNKYFSAKKDVHVIQLSQNIGYGKANNEAVKFANSDFLAICNPDTEVLPGTISGLLEVLKNDKTIGLVVPVLQTKAGDILENCREFPTILSLIKRRIMKSPFLKENIPRKKIIETEWAQGSFWVLRTEIYRKIKGFDDRFFLFMEDIDFCQRVWGLGLKVVQNTEAIAIHSPNRLSGGFILSAIFRKTFWIHIYSAALYFWKWK